MRDQHSIPILAKLHPKVRQDFQDFIEQCENTYDVTIRIVQGLRTFEEQQAIYDQGRTKPGAIVTKAPPGSSYHNYGMAVDVVPLTADKKGLDWNYDFSKWAILGTKWGISWGGNWTGFKDLDHFEEKCGHNWRDLLDMYNRKDFIPGTQYVNI
jgi:peptidoglycan L-alanyl-D-glutamate endopeptidase CwlK